MDARTSLKLSKALIEHDRCERKKKSYPSFAMGTHLQALEHVKAKTPPLPLREALVCHFSGILLNKLLLAVNEMEIMIMKTYIFTVEEEGNIIEATEVQGTSDNDAWNNYTKTEIYRIHPESEYIHAITSYTSINEALEQENN